MLIVAIFFSFQASACCTANTTITASTCRAWSPGTFDVAVSYASYVYLRQAMENSLFPYFQSPTAPGTPAPPGPCSTSPIGGILPSRPHSRTATTSAPWPTTAWAATSTPTPCSAGSPCPGPSTTGVPGTTEGSASTPSTAVSTILISFSSFATYYFTRPTIFQFKRNSRIIGFSRPPDQTF